MSSAIMATTYRLDANGNPIYLMPSAASIKAGGPPVAGTPQPSINLNSTKSPAMQVKERVMLLMQGGLGHLTSDGDACLGRIFQRNVAMTEGVAMVDKDFVMMAPNTAAQIRSADGHVRLRTCEALAEAASSIDLQQETIVRVKLGLPKASIRPTAQRLDRLDAVRQAAQNLSARIAARNAAGDCSDDTLLGFAAERSRLLDDLQTVTDALTNARGQMEVVDELLHQMGQGIA